MKSQRDRSAESAQVVSMHEKDTSTRVGDSFEILITARANHRLGRP